MFCLTGFPSMMKQAGLARRLSTSSSIKLSTKPFTSSCPAAAIFKIVNIFPGPSYSQLQAVILSLLVENAPNITLRRSCIVSNLVNLKLKTVLGGTLYFEHGCHRNR